MIKKYLTLYPSCIIVKGAIRSTISDLEKADFHYVPNDMADVITHLKTTDYQEFVEGVEKSDKETIEEYVNFLLKNDLAFFTERPELYPEISLQFYPQAKIANAIIDRNEQSAYDIFAVIDELNRYNCRHLQLRFYSEYDIDQLDSILLYIQKTDILSVEIFYKYKGDKLSVLKKLINKWTKIKLFLVHSAPFSEIFILNKKNFYTSNMGSFIYTDEIISSEQNCGCISFSYFTVNLSTFSESLHYNTCLKNKLSIDVNGKIKNCPAMTHDFGNFGEESFKDILISKEYSNYGDITKDQIAVCKDCEHRHFCTDCRAFVADILDKPAKCGYDPYTAKWEGVEYRLSN